MVVLVALGVGAVAARPWAARRYQSWRQARALKQAEEFVQKKDGVNAMFSLRVALGADPGNPAAWRSAADFLESAGDREAVKLRQHIVTLEPENAADRLAWVRTALRFRDADAAKTALAGVPAGARASNEYRQAAAAVALAAGRPVEADAWLADMLAADPQNGVARLGRLSLHLRYGRGETMAAARRELLALSKSEPWQAEAWRELAADALRRNDREAALGYAEALTRLPAPLLEDELLRADVLILLGREPASAITRRLGARVSRHPAETVKLAAWLMAQGEAAVAGTWLDTLPDDVAKVPLVAATRADVAGAARDWDDLARRLHAGAWGRVPADAVTLAMSARLLRERTRLEVSMSVWGEALRASAKDVSGLRVLHRLCQLWGWEGAQEELWWTVAREHAQQTWAHQALVDRFYARKDTVGLRQVYALWREAEPGNARVEGDWAVLSLLTAAGRPPAQLKESVERLFARDPQNPFFVTAHALALWKNGQAAAAVAVMERLPASERELPGRAFYSALYLAGVQRWEEAERYLAPAEKAALLPEEQALFEAARTAILAARKPVAVQTRER